MKAENKLLLFILLVIIILVFTYPRSPTANVVKADEDIDIQVFFCPRENCTAAYLSTIAEAKESVYCAFFDLDLVEINNLIKEKKVKKGIVVDGENSQIKDEPYIIIENKSSYMHNKFCIIDEKTVITGSTNPTINDVEKNNNNLLIIHSTILAQNYLQEYDELSHKIYSKGSPVPHPIITDTKKNITIQNYFCPEDHCEDHIVQELKKAKHSIRFMTFSFTSDPIATTLIQKYYEGVDILGIYEKTQLSEYSTFHKLSFHNLSVITDHNPKFLHHKVFIIDDNTVITGSFNPTSSGNEKNDENIVVIDDPTTTRLYAEEFKRLRE